MDGGGGADTGTPGDGNDTPAEGRRDLPRHARARRDRSGGRPRLLPLRRDGGQWLLIATEANPDDDLTMVEYP
ncbi:MAG: hypothetical protein M5U28_28815 [Sandaracinaceae bacterium]|nr:hypothetical protein [Sandaracinaceae bacterium]